MSGRSIALRVFPPRCQGPAWGPTPTGIQGISRQGVQPRPVGAAVVPARKVEFLNFALELGSVIVGIAEPALQRNEPDARNDDIRFDIPNYVVVCVSKERDQPKRSLAT